MLPSTGVDESVEVPVNTSGLVSWIWEQNLSSIFSREIRRTTRGSYYNVQCCILLLNKRNCRVPNTHPHSQGPVLSQHTPAAVRPKNYDKLSKFLRKLSIQLAKARPAACLGTAPAAISAVLCKDVCWTRMGQGRRGIRRSMSYYFTTQKATAPKTVPHVNKGVQRATRSRRCHTQCLTFRHQEHLLFLSVNQVLQLQQRILPLYRSSILYLQHGYIDG